MGEITIQIHRGANQIGGNIIEISTPSTKILLDAGAELDSGDDNTLPAIHGLFSNANYNAVFFSHYHQDHMGLADKIDAQIPLYMGEGAYRVLQAAARYRGKPLGFTCRTFTHGENIHIGDLCITPFLVDHSAYDAYMCLITHEGETVLYTGDFRANGRKSFFRFKCQLPTKIDTLICEGTTLSRSKEKILTEKDIEKQATQLMRKKNRAYFYPASRHQY
ncbi:MAG: MBL fold metallo-hydrolase [Defluviitaleaceae bacterium]|nr:MBL fold metallo-hydrolase [Defluviitaleaceae bacterium]MCL2274238.1 MBL fold metallo-hydrolase [Defluviitaleaceae bacterium]